MPAIAAYLAGAINHGGATGVDLFSFREESWGKPNHKPSINHPPLGFLFLGIPIRDDFLYLIDPHYWMVAENLIIALATLWNIL